MSKIVQEHRVALTSIASAPHLLGAAGLDAEAIARRAGLKPHSFDDPLRTISFQEMGRYLGECTRATQDEGFSLRVGLTEGPAALTTLGFVAMNTPNVRGALTTLAKYLHQYAGDISVTQENGLALFTYVFHYPQIEGAGYISDAAMGLAIAFLRALCGPSWSPVEVRFSRQVPFKPGDWKRDVQAPVYFGAEQNLIVFSARWLEHSIERADPDLRRLLLDKVAELEVKGGQDFPAHVGAIIRASLLAGDASLDHVAGRLALSSATFKRRLQANGTSYTELIDQTRMEMASQLLKNSRATMTQIAEILGYAHSSTFSRSFSRWANMSPRDWRTANARGRNASLEPRISADGAV